MERKHREGEGEGDGEGGSAVETRSQPLVYGFWILAGSPSRSGRKADEEGDDDDAEEPRQ